jgi:hypothetical protein
MRYEQRSRAIRAEPIRLISRKIEHIGGYAREDRRTCGARVPGVTRPCSAWALRPSSLCGIGSVAMTEPDFLRDTRASYDAVATAYAERFGDELDARGCRCSASICHRG